MPDKARRPAVSLTLVVAVIAAGLIAGCGEPKKETGFQERGQAAGLAFRMNFLEKEQGERFRINLYDHGAGLAVGDYDNDGHEDIYFLNQHGPNALYRNTGNGSFVDVTAKAGVAVGDRISVGARFAGYDTSGLPPLASSHRPAVSTRKRTSGASGPREARGALSWPISMAMTGSTS